MSVIVKAWWDFQITVTQFGFTALLDTQLYGGKHQKNNNNNKKKPKYRVSRPCFSVRGSCKMLMWINLLSYIVFCFLTSITLTLVVSSLVETGFAMIVVVWCVDAIYKIKRVRVMLFCVVKTSKSILSQILFLKMLLLSPISASLSPSFHRRNVIRRSTKPSGRVVAKAKDNTEAGGVLEKVAIGGSFVSTPVIGWSLYTLKTTGCGLPPGPAGSIGALEGVSYLLVVGIVGWSLYTKTKTGSGLPNGPFGLLGAVEGLSYLSVLAILVVFGLQFLNNGSVPGPLPSDQCFG